jgi:hypothetical protein
METAVEWLVEKLTNGHYLDEGMKQKIIEQAKEMEEKQKLKYQLFIGKVSEIIGDQKTFELLKESQETIKLE